MLSNIPLESLLFVSFFLMPLPITIRDSHLCYQQDKVFELSWSIHLPHVSNNPSEKETSALMRCSILCFDSKLGNNTKLVPTKTIQHQKDSTFISWRTSKVLSNKQKQWRRTWNRVQGFIRAISLVASMVMPKMEGSANSRCVCVDFTESSQYS